MKGVVLKGLLQIALIMVLLLAATGARAEDEVEVRGCVVDSGGKPFRNVKIELSGLNYRGGAGYTGNNSMDWTNEQGEFSLRMKAGTKEAPARAKLSGRYEVYVTKGWNGSRPFGGTDVWPDLPPVENTGQPVDLRKKGCVPFNYPFDVSGTVVSDSLDPYPTGRSVKLRITVGGAYSEMTVAIPRPGFSNEFNFGIDLRRGDAYAVRVMQPQAEGVDCQVVGGSSGRAGFGNLELLPSSYNIWTSNDVRVKCSKVPLPQTGALEDIVPRRTIDPNVRNTFESGIQNAGNTLQEQKNERDKANMKAAQQARDYNCLKIMLSGNLNDAEDYARRQKALYEGSCSDASDAADKVAQANRSLQDASARRARDASIDEMRAVGQALAGAIVAYGSVRDSTEAYTNFSAQSLPAQSSSSTANSVSVTSSLRDTPQGPIHNPANEAANCISTFQEKNTSIIMQNNCTYTVSVLWPSGLWDIRPGVKWPSQLYEPFTFSACRYGGVNGAGLLRRGDTVICHD